MSKGWIVREPMAREDLGELAARQFGDLVKAVVDVGRGVMAVGGDEWIEFDSMINVRPLQANRSRDVEDPVVRASIRSIVDSLVRH